MESPHHLPHRERHASFARALLPGGLALLSLAMWDPGSVAGWPPGVAAVLLLLPFVVGLAFLRDGRPAWILAAGTILAAVSSSLMAISAGGLPAMEALSFSLPAGISLAATIGMIRLCMRRVWGDQHTVIARLMTERNAWQRRCQRLSARQAQRELADNEGIDFASLLIWMREVGQRVSGHHERRTLSTAIIATTRALLRCPECELFLWNAGKQTFEHDTARVPTVLSNHRMREWLLEERRILTRDGIEDEHALRGMLRAGSLPDAIAPLTVGGELLGVLYVDGIEQVTPRELRLLYVVCGLAALGLKNCQLLHRVQELARRDSLTGLLNHGSFHQDLRRRVGETKKTSGPLSLIISDIDFFKTFNDRHGHLAGDYVLRELARLWQAVMPDDAICGRHGGEEFVCMLPGRNLARAAELAEALREAMLEFPWLFEGHDLSVTASFGVAEIGKPAIDAEDLIRLADAALYRAKHAGRNRVELVRAGDRRTLEDLPIEDVEPVRNR